MLMTDDEKEQRSFRPAGTEPPPIIPFILRRVLRLFLFWS